MLTLGIIGGMGPEASQVMYKEITERTAAVKDQDHIDVILYSHASMPDRTAAIKEGRGEELGRLLAEDAKKLRRFGADLIAIPCNTSHCFIEQVQAAVDVPVVNMIEETAAYIRRTRPDARRIGVLATDGTLGAGLYHKALRRQGIEPFVPDERRQKLVMSLIYDQIKAGQRGSREDFAAVDYYLKKNGCDGAVLACTELSVFRANHELDSYYVDAMKILVERCVTLCGGRLKDEGR